MEQLRSSPPQRSEEDERQRSAEQPTALAGTPILFFPLRTLSPSSFFHFPIKPFFPVIASVIMRKLWLMCHMIKSAVGADVFSSWDCLGVSVGWFYRDSVANVDVFFASVDDDSGFPLWVADFSAFDTCHFVSVFCLYKKTPFSGFIPLIINVNSARNWHFDFFFEIPVL